MGKFYDGARAELILFARYMAWLHAVPTPRSRSVAQGPAKRITRAEQLGTDAAPPPPVMAQHLVEYWREAGLTQAIAGSAVPLTSTELQAWQRMSGIDLTPWEYGTIRAMSRAYVSQLHESEAPDCPSPCAPELTEDMRVAAAQKMRRALRMMGSGNKHG